MGAPLDFTYRNESGRPTGPFVRAAGLVLPGVRQVQRTVAPIAQQWRSRNLEALASDGPRWVALGDSLTLGIGAASPDGSWVARVAAGLRADGHPLAVVNLAASGATVADVLQRQVPVLGRIDDVELVTLMVGSNDLMKPRSRAGLADRYAELLRALPRGAVVATLPNPSPSAEAANRVLRAAAGPGGLVVAELRDPRTSSWRGRLAADHFHPNERGYEAIAAVMLDTVRGSCPAPGPPGV